MRPLSLGGNQQRSRDRILYVEDERANWDVVELRLSKAYELQFARNSREACERLKAGDRFSAILMDVQLRDSDHDGLELAELLRDGPGPGEQSFALGLPSYCRTVPILFVTAFTDDETRSRAGRIRSASFVSKPIDFSQLTLALARSHLSRLGS